MSLDNKENRIPERESNTSQSRNNNGTIGGEGGYEKEPKGSFHKMSERLSGNKPVNEKGIGENQENHASGSKTQKVPSGNYASNEIDPNREGSKNSSGDEIKYPKKGYNHIENSGGTSAEELDENNNYSI